MKDDAHDRVEELIQRVLLGDGDAFAGELYGHLCRLGQRVLGRRVLCHHTREDIILDAMRRFWESIEDGSFQGPASKARPYYSKIVHNRMLGYFRGLVLRNSRWAEVSLDALGELGDRPTDRALLVPEVVSTKEECERVLRCKQAMPPYERLVLELRFTSDLSLAELALVLGKTRDQARHLVDRALKMIQRALENGGV